MTNPTLTIFGEPATFATRGEIEWKRVLASAIGQPSLGGKESGIVLDFALSSLERGGHPFDVDNLCEPVLVVLIRQAGWFGRAKSGVRWWSARKGLGAPSRCELTIVADGSPALPASEPTLSGTYRGPLPRSATARDVADWATSARVSAPFAQPVSCQLYLGFGSPTVNIADISTGAVKPFVDCLYPFFGGKAGDPEDHRVVDLMVEKAVPGLSPDAVLVKLWSIGERASQVPKPTISRQASSISVDGNRASRNPCRLGSAKWIVVESAFQRRKVSAVRVELERLKQGSGGRLSEYIADVRHENRLDLKIEGDVLICRGSLPL